MTTWERLRARPLYEDHAIVVVNKPPGIAVAGDRHEADLSTEARAAGEFAMAAHRIDKVTTGAVVFARSAEVHAQLARQFQRRSVTKEYLAIVAGVGLPPTGTIDLPLTEGRKGRVRVAALRDRITADTADSTWTVAPDDLLAGSTPHPSVTTFTTVATGAGTTLLVVRPLTGRRHQLRVHLAWIGFPIVGDPLFTRGETGDGRTHLHAWRIAFDAEWDDGRRIEVDAPPPDDLWSPLGADRLAATPPAALLERARAAG